MNVDCIIAIVASFIVLIIVTLILLGRGDWLISGYNTSRKEERSKYNIVRLRVLTSVSMLLLLIFVWLFEILDVGNIVYSSVILSIAIISAILQYTWARR
ncbi:MAG: DUF3784 domain-containing protein [Alistipes sp.]|nr:DUF3784 domain-containing protein [Alistipes sp.]MBR5584641.1 DUF3784 domain-containing protein [Alistipes sp.]